MNSPALEVSVVFSPVARQLRQVCLQLPEGSTVADAVRASGLLADLPAADVDALLLGVWGKKVAPSQRLRGQDRVEIYRPLKVDPKVARRERFVRQGVKSAGLFAQRRPGAKAGY